ncbi:unnamed protein product [Brachionus calyciflorus]|uniref:MULE domain-containing protein n=1 Tax=Brachionus calyciflorus TaxID=104777 RepID=A0A814MFK0_9BILA|nr:unnamed protein product [Brachionus calyciflorus]
MWNVFDRTIDGMPRTNNNLEGWHNAFQSGLKSHPHLLKLIDHLRMEQSETECEYVRLAAGKLTKRRPKYAIIEENLSNIIKDYSLDNILDYLKNISFNLNY